MPYGMCPVCGAAFHMNVADVEQWYPTYYPTVPLGEVVPARCFSCWAEITEGDSVIVYNPLRKPNVSPDAEGIVHRVVSSKDGNLYLVKLMSGQEIFFVRPELRKAREGSSTAGTS